MYEKINRNSLGQQLRKREILIHAATFYVPEVGKPGEKGHKRAFWAPNKPFNNPLRVLGSRRVGGHKRGELRRG